ncbi:MAG: thymidylate synthase [bacterium]
MFKSDELYEFGKFKVHLGKGDTVGFCTVWNEAEAAVKRAPKLDEIAAIVGTLYSRHGVNVILRNLARKPSLRRLYLWGFGTLSQTKYGVMGTDVLRALWKNGVGDDRVIPGTSFKLEPGIAPEVVRVIIENVELIDVSASSLEEAVEKIDATPKPPYMEPVDFPTPPQKNPEKYPSEEVGFLTRGTGIIDAWKKLVSRIMAYGTVKGTQYGAQQKELVSATWVIQGEDPDSVLLPTDWPDNLCAVTGAAKEMLEEYFHTNFVPEAPVGVKYTYGNRLMAYEIGGVKYNMIEDVILRSLRSSPDSRRAAVTTFVPATDKDSSEPPCLTQIQCLQSGGTLHLLAIFRSHDIFKGAIANAYALRRLQKEIATELGFALGALKITSESAHIYENDWENARRLVDCAFWSRDPSLVFSADDADPRGNFVITVEDGAIKMTLMGPDGAVIYGLSGKSARFLQRKLGQLGLISDIGHAVDIGMELQKAQIAMERGMVYTQDRPLPF